MLSRVADSLYWMSRYIERAENNARILDVNQELVLDFENVVDPDAHVRDHWTPIITSLEDHELFSKLYKQADQTSVVDFLTFQRKNPNSIQSCLAYARENARTVREQISSEMWEQINKLYLFIQSKEVKKAFRASPYDFFKRIVDGSHLFQGITDATMNHGEGWEFMQFGKFLERADRTSRILDLKYHTLLPTGEQVGGNVDTIQWMAVLKSVSAMEAYLKVYVGVVAPWKVAEFLICHDNFPRAIHFCVDRLDEALHRISGCDLAHFCNEAERLSGRLRSQLAYMTIDEIFNSGLHQFLDRTQLELVLISEAMQSIYGPAVVAAGEQIAS